MTNSTQLNLPNVYWITIVSPFFPAPHDMYVAADFVGAAVRKAQRECVLQFRFRPMRTNSVIKVKRLRARHYFDHLQGVQDAYELAHRNGESDICKKLAGRLALVVRLLDGAIDNDDVWKKLCDAMGESPDSFRYAA